MVEKDTWKLITATALFTVAVTTIIDYAWTSWQAQKQVIAQQKNKNKGGQTKSDTDKYYPINMLLSWEQVELDLGWLTLWCGPDAERSGSLILTRSH